MSPPADAAGLAAAPRTRSRRREWVPFVSYGSSLLFHGLVLALLIAVVLPRETHRPGPPGEPSITVRWVTRIPERAVPREEPLSPTALPSPAPRPAPAEEPQAARGEARPERTAPGTRRAPKAAGPAFSPPPLPLRGEQLARRAIAGTSGFGTRGSGKSAALGRYGGDAATEDAVSRGLRWLAEHRDPRGGWRAADYTRHCRDSVPCRGTGGPDYDVGVTALAVLAFLGAGHLPDVDGGTAATTERGRGFATGPYGSVVDAALDYLLREQATNGCFGMNGSNYMYNHAIATFAMAEAYALAGDPRYGESTARAVQFTAYGQQTGGGWDYASIASGRDDLSISGWQVMALASATRAGVDVPGSTLSRLGDYLDRAIRPDGIAIYANRGTEAGRRGINMVAVGLLSRILLGEPPERPSMFRAADLLLAPEHAPSWDRMEKWEKHFQSYYYWYTASLALFLHSAERDRERWDAWNHFMRRELLRLQSRRRHEDGSWRPEPNWIGVSGGRIYATAINVLTLETYYRYTPLPSVQAPITRSR